MYQFICHPLGLVSALRISTKLMKFPISTLRGLNFLLIFYLDDILLTAKALKITDFCRGYIVFSVAESEISDKYRKISTLSLSMNKFF